jgi:glycosyltransferase involved in cell wall biosynthesis
MLGNDVPEQSALPLFVRRVGFVDKSTAEGRARFDELFGGSHFLMLPARAEAFGVVLCEAGSYGVPAIASRAGGIPTIIRDNINGRLFDIEDAESMSNAIRSLMQDRAQYESLARSSFSEYQQRLNWDVAGRTVKHLLQQVLQKPSS